MAANRLSLIKYLALPRRFAIPNTELPIKTSKTTGNRAVEARLFTLPSQLLNGRNRIDMQRRNTTVAPID